MTPHLELGLGLIIGFGAAMFLFWTVNLIRSKKIFTDQESAKMLRVAERILSEIDAPSLIVDSSGKVIFANETVREIESANDLYSQIREPEVQSALLKALMSETPSTIDPNTVENERSLRLGIFALDPQHAVIFASDTGSESRIIAMRRDFITNISHELKTPIAAIGLLSEAILKAGDSPEIVKRFSKKLKGEADRLNELSRDVIKLSEAQTPLVSNESAQFDLVQTLEREVRAHTEIANQHGVKLTFTNENKKGRQAIVRGRESALSAAIANLISNAVKHSPAGSNVEIVVQKIQKDVIITVQDQGPGISSEYQDRIFERFFRIDESRSRQHGGTGLGLSIVRNAVRTHGGDVTVVSKLGEGATFKMRVPLTKRKAKQ